MTILDAPEVSEHTEEKRIVRSWRAGRIVILLIGIIVLVGAIYYGVGFMLTNLVDSRYAERDCDKLIPLAEFIEKAYPTQVAPFTDPARKQAEECQVYRNAEMLYNEKSWEKAYQALSRYFEMYPKGIYAKESRDQAAVSLLAWASEQRSNRDFAKAVGNLTFLLSEYQDTPSVSEAEETLPEVYLDWGADCRMNSEFAEAEMVYLSLQEWASEIGKEDFNTRALAELAQMYFDWGKDLQKRNNFSLAKTKFDNAINNDPDAKSTNSPSAQTRAYLPGFHRSWGDYLVARGSFSEAIEHFKTSINLSSPDETDAAKNTLAKAYLDWAISLRKREDYNQALDKIESAKETAATDAVRDLVDSTNEVTLSLFSQSKGAQAQKIINDIVKSICASGKTISAPPIIGTLNEKRLQLNGVSLTLPNNVLATTPGSLRFVACATENKSTVQKCPYSSTGFGFASHWIERIRYTWKITVFRAVDGFRATERTFHGSEPEYCPTWHTFSSIEFTHYHYGERPSATTVTTWLASLLK